MRFSVRWLRNYLQTDLPVNRIVEGLTSCGLEVEKVIDLGLLSGKLVVGEILAIEPVAGADKIRLVTVRADEPEPLKIVCGAHNIEVGHKVPTARFGMVFPDGFELKPRKIMGIEGQGMLCSAKELGVAEDAAGIWILPDDAPVGKPWDAVVEISITPNRPDALSILGIARDLAAKFSQARDHGRTSLVQPDLSVPEEGEKTESVARVVIEAREDCPRYTARVIRNVRIGPSPRWIQVVLESAGLRPINNVVDITNLVLLELGHPLHAFDLDRLAGSTIVVRLAKPNETITTLDGQTQKLEPTDLLICDAEKPVALAGIMGGGNSEISEGTTNILLESAYFRPQTIRKTSKRLDKSTDASYRFERGTDARRVTAALNRCAALIAKYASGTVCKGIIDVVGRITDKDPILVRIGRVNKLLGLSLTGREIVDVLSQLGFEVQRADREEMLVAPPTHRVDVSIEADIIEEIARIVGYDRIPEEKLAMPRENQPLSPIEQVRIRLSEAAVSIGYCQAVNFSFIGESGNALLGVADDRQIRVQNPVTADMSVMRRGMLPSLLNNAVYNTKQSVDDIALFEIGHTYEFEGDEEPRDRKEMRPPAKETPYFAALLSGHSRRFWRGEDREHDFYDIKGHAEFLLRAIGLQKIVVEAAPNVPWLHPGRAARFLVKGQVVALFGEVHPSLCKEMDLRHRTCYLEIPLAGPVLEAGIPRYTDIPRFPAVTRDIALVVDRAVRSQDLERTIRKAGKDLLHSVRVFDLYEGEHVPTGKKSLAYSLTYRAADRTLKEEEVTTRHGEVLAALEKDNGAVLRS